MNIAIAGVGLATAQGSSAAILTGVNCRSPAALPWLAKNWNISRSCYSASELDPSLSGPERWQMLVTKAFGDLGNISYETPLFVGSCNGGASEDWGEAFEASVLLRGTPWVSEPVFSSSCASGIHALYAATQLLSAGAIDEALVLAADVLSQSNHENFESLRVLAEKPSAPWQSTSNGFILGEAAVVLKLTRAKDDGALLDGPELGNDLLDHDGLSGVLDGLSCLEPSLIVGQGTGPFQNDTAELAAFSAFVDKNVPVATPLSNFGHTLGASGLLAVALAALLQQTRAANSLLTTSADVTMDGRPLLHCRGGPPWPPLRSREEVKGGHGGPPLQMVLSACRALNGACAATAVGSESRIKIAKCKGLWRKSEKPGPLMNQPLRSMALEALEHRPSEPPDILILRMEKPLSPVPAAIIGGRLLPSAVLEITPGFASQLIARCWGFSGPALCLVGDVDADVYGLRNVLEESGKNVFQVNLRGSGENRDIEWNA